MKTLGLLRGCMLFAFCVCGGVLGSWVWDVRADAQPEPAVECVKCGKCNQGVERVGHYVDNAPWCKACYKDEFSPKVFCPICKHGPGAPCAICGGTACDGCVVEIDGNRVCVKCSEASGIELYQETLAEAEALKPNNPLASVVQKNTKLIGFLYVNQLRVGAHSGVPGYVETGEEPDDPEPIEGEGE